MSTRSVFCLFGLSCIVVFNGSLQPVRAEEKMLVGVVTARSGNQIVFKTNSAVSYRAEASYASIVRRNGSVLPIEDILIGDKIEVRGQVWADNSVSVRVIRDMSVYTHAITCIGKISTIDSINKLLILQGSYGALQTIHVTEASEYMKNGTTVEFKDLSVGMSATVRGTWDRSRQDVVATSIRVTARLLNIDFTGEVALKDGLALTVVANGVLYAVDSAGATVKSKNNKTLALTEVGLGRVRIWGKHIAESVAIKATRIKYLDLVK